MYYSFLIFSLFSCLWRDARDLRPGKAGHMCVGRVNKHAYLMDLNIKSVLGLAERKVRGHANIDRIVSYALTPLCLRIACLRKALIHGHDLTLYAFNCATHFD